MSGHAKNWLAQVASELEKTSPLRMPRRHLAAFSNHLGEEKGLARFLTPHSAIDVAAEVHRAGVLPSYPELTAHIRLVGERRERLYPGSTQAKAAGQGGENQGGLSTMDRSALDMFHEIIEERKGQAREITISWLRTYHRPAYILIADDYDRERFREEKRRFAESRERQEQYARTVAQVKFVQSQRVSEFVPADKVPSQALAVARQNALPQQRYQASRDVAASPPKRHERKGLSPEAVAALRAGMQTGERFR